MQSLILYGVLAECNTITTGVINWGEEAITDDGVDRQLGSRVIEDASRDYAQKMMGFFRRSSLRGKRAIELGKRAIVWEEGAIADISGELVAMIRNILTIQPP